MKEKVYWIIFCDNKLLLEKNNDFYSFPFSLEPPFLKDEDNIHTITKKNGKIYKTFNIDNTEECNLKSPYQFVDLRESYELIPQEDYNIAGKASQYLYWDKFSIYCSHCGTKTIRISNICKKCPKCNHEFFPSIAPAVIVRIHKDDSILLVRARNFRGKFNGLVAGFLEGGETLEECVQREVMEETGIKIKDIKYFGSQSWPYPSGIMIGFTANYVDGAIKIQEEELASAGFFKKDNLPEIPKKLSIARRMIDAWLQEK